MRRVRDYLLGFAVGIAIVAAGILISDYVRQRLEARAADARKSECIGEVLKTDAPVANLAAMAVICVEDQ